MSPTDYPPAPGDVDSEKSFPYDVHYKVVPGFTFAMCQSGQLTPEVHFVSSTQPRSTPTPRS